MLTSIITGFISILFFLSTESKLWNPESLDSEGVLATIKMTFGELFRMFSFSSFRRDSVKESK